MRSGLFDKYMKQGFWTAERVQFELKSRYCIEVKYTYLKMVLSQNKRPAEYLAIAIGAIVAPNVRVALLFPECLKASSGKMQTGARLVHQTSVPKAPARRSTQSMTVR